MSKTNPISLRLAAEVKTALEKAAKEDERSLSAMAERILKAWLIDRGYLPK